MAEQEPAKTVVKEEKPLDGTEHFISTHSDAPEPEEVKEVAKPEGAATPKEGEEESAVKPTDTPGKDTPAEPAEAEKKGKSKTQKRIDKLTRKNSETSRKNEALQRENDELKAKQAKPTKAKVAPKEEDFPDDYEAFLEADAKFEEAKGETPAPKKTEKAPEKPVEDKLSDSQKTAHEFVQENLANAEGKPDDFKAVVFENKDLIVTGVMLEALAECDDVAKVAYALGSDTELAEKIAGQSPAQVARAIAKLDMAPAAKKPKKPTEVSNAPDPIKPLGGSDAQTKEDSELSFAEHEAKYNEKDKAGTGWNS